jgi:hypothetical protein
VDWCNNPFPRSPFIGLESARWLGPPAALMAGPPRIGMGERLSAQRWITGRFRYLLVASAWTLDVHERLPRRRCSGPVARPGVGETGMPTRSLAASVNPETVAAVPTAHVSLAARDAAELVGLSGCRQPRLDVSRSVRRVSHRGATGDHVEVSIGVVSGA